MRKIKLIALKISRALLFVILFTLGAIFIVIAGIIGGDLYKWYKSQRYKLWRPEMTLGDKIKNY